MLGLILAACTRDGMDSSSKEASSTETPDPVEPEDTSSGTTGDTGCLDADQDGVCTPLDCDDDDPGSYPGADDPAGDGVDSDCDGGDGDFTREMADGAVWVPELATGEAGHALVAGPDVDEDGRPEVIVGAPVHLTYPYDSTAADGFVTVLSAEAQSLGSWVGSPASRAGTTLASGGDLDGDGALDIVVGSVGAGGTAWVVPAAALAGSGALVDLVTAEVHGLNAGSSVNGPLTISGDITGDGAADLVLQIRRLNDTEVGIFPGPLPLLQSIDDAAYVLAPEADADQAGYPTIADVDLDGDGASDLVVAASEGNNQTGLVYVLLGPLISSGSLADAPIKLTGSGENARTGRGLSNAGDVDEDGHDDLLVGAPLDDRDGDRGGRAFLVLDNSSSGVLEDVALTTFIPDQGHRFLGDSLARGDLDGDGEVELLVAAPDDWYFPEGPGEVWIYRSSVSGTVSRSDAWRILQGAQTGDVAGASLATADLDGDGRTDIAMGAPGDDEVGLNAGKVYLVMGASLDP